MELLVVLWVGGADCHVVDGVSRGIVDGAHADGIDGAARDAVDGAVRQRSRDNEWSDCLWD
jgi:hypothetical protein